MPNMTLLSTDAPKQTPLSWQPPMPAPVTKCGECPYSSSDFDVCYKVSLKSAPQIYEENKDGITSTCPMWQQQNKEKL